MGNNYIKLHNLIEVDGISRWKPISGNRVIELQKWKGRLYLVGCMYRGFSQTLPFEATLKQVVDAFGELEPR